MHVYLLQAAHCLIGCAVRMSLRLAIATHTGLWWSEHALALSHGAGWDIGEPQPLPFQQLTQLQLHDGDYDVSDVLTMISALPQLEVLEVLDFTIEALELRAFDAAVLSRLPQLRRVDLSGSLLWEDPSHDDPSGHQPVQGDDMVDYLPVRVVQQLLHLQRTYPNITWAVDGM